MNSSRRTHRQNFGLPLPPVLLVGAVLSAVFYGLIFAGPLDFAILRRYCLSHPVAIASVCLFSLGIVCLLQKWWSARSQTRATAKAASVLRRLVRDGQSMAANKRPEWLAASWETQAPLIRQSWLGARIQSVVDLQISRGRRNQLDSDLKSFSEMEGDQQHDSYSLLRIINWAMPMLGFLGTVLGISQTLGRLDTKMLATQQQDAMNQLTAGLYVAFDTTAIALVLTVFLMFVQFAVSRLEQSILSEIDAEVNDCLIQFLSADPHDAQDSLLTPVREVMENLLEGVRQLVFEQAALWNDALSETQRQWTTWTGSVWEQVESQFGKSVGTALDKHVTELSKLQEEWSRNQDLRWQQWQTTLSDQARMIQGQQKEMIKQSDSLQQLVTSTAELRKLEETIHDSVGRLENVGRIEEATECVGEAVALLATCLERAGVIRGTPIRPRIAKKTAGAQTDPVASTTEAAPPETVPFPMADDDHNAREAA